MFYQLVRYEILKMIRTREEIFWCLLFPLILGTLFYVSFGTITQKEENFQTIDIGYIEDGVNKDETFETVLNELSQKEENALIHITTTNEEESKQLLLDKKIAGIFYNTGELSLTVNAEGLNQSILNAFLNQYIQKKETILRIAQTSPNQMNTVLELLEHNSNGVKEISFTTANPNPMISYFYALIAMSCLYGCFAGLNAATNIKADLSTLGARRIVAPTNKMKIILSDFIGAVIVQFLCTMITVCYLIYGLKIDMGQKLIFLMITVLFGSIIGIATGMFIGCIGKGSNGTKSAMMIAITMGECFLSGLMVGNMKDIVEQYAPIINRINPAALIVDALYSLDIYNTYERYTRNLVSMFIIASILCIISFLAIRRERYASI